MPPSTDPLAALAASSAGSHGVLFTFLLFVIPTGAGIPAGVLLGQRIGLTAGAMSGLYVGSGLLRAAVFEPVFRWLARRSHAGGRVARWHDASRDLLARHAVLSRAVRGVWAPVVVSYNLDPMGGRVAAAAVGMGWLRGWLLALLADFAYFVSTALPTLWLQRLVGNEWLTLLLVIVLSTVIPMAWLRLRRSPASSAGRLRTPTPASAPRSAACASPGTPSSPRGNPSTRRAG